MGLENPIHLLFLGAVALLVLGPKRLPDLAKALGNGIREFRESIEVGEDGEKPASPNGTAAVAAEQAPVAAASPAPAPPATESPAAGTPPPADEPSGTPPAADAPPPSGAPPAAETPPPSGETPA